MTIRFSQWRWQCQHFVRHNFSATRYISTQCPSNGTPNVSLTFHENSSVALLKLCNSRRRNALTVSMMEQLDEHVQALARWSSGATRGSNVGGDSMNSSDEKQWQEGKNNNARLLILTGSDGTFCAGLDLHDNEREDAADAVETGAVHSLREGINMIKHMTRVTNRLMALPVLSAVDGYAVGGGAELSSCTDLVVLSRTARIKFVHSKRGASTGWGGCRRLVKKVGRAKALRMLLLGESVCGDEEAQCGCVYADAVGEIGETSLEATKRLIVDKILDLPCPQSIRALKSAVSAVDGDGDVIDLATGEPKLENTAMMGEFESFMSVWGGDSNREQIQKAKSHLQEKRKKK
ncbi:hypothetical protein ACHAWF_014788 [Thalassiosira exigua]